MLPAGGFSLFGGEWGVSGVKVESVDARLHSFVRCVRQRKGNVYYGKLFAF
jgi:hypothetical protein